MRDTWMQVLDAVCLGKIAWSQVQHEWVRTVCTQYVGRMRSNMSCIRHLTAVTPTHNKVTPSIRQTWACPPRILTMPAHIIVVLLVACVLLHNEIPLSAPIAA